MAWWSRMSNGRCKGPKICAQEKALLASGFTGSGGKSFTTIREFAVRRGNVQYDQREANGQTRVSSLAKRVLQQHAILSWEIQSSEMNRVRTKPEIIFSGLTGEAGRYSWPLRASCSKRQDPSCVLS